MKVVVAHNFYQQGGGEDEVFESELKLLESRGHRPVRFVMHNDDIAQMGKLKLAAATIWNRDAARKLGEIVRESRADVVHFHNTFPLISPAAYAAARAEGAAVVQTLHNFRMLCPNALFFRDGAVCEDCLGKSFAWPGVKNKCYRGSRGASAAVATLSAVHRLAGTWRDAVDLYITPSNLAREKFIAGGLPAEKIIVKPHFLDPDPGVGEGGGGYAVYVGRLSVEKGPDTLLAAWRLLDPPVPLKIIGDGPLGDQLKAAAAGIPGIEWLGRRPLSEVCDIIGRADFLVFPSRCYETFGRVAVEAFAKGTPVVGCDHGSMLDIITPGRTGLRFEPSNPQHLATQVRAILSDRQRLQAMRRHARAQYESLYTGEKNYQQLMKIYDGALSAQRAAPAGAVSYQGLS
jgi:glycosyltransferase involved in cell wall biosynthesis